MRLKKYYGMASGRSDQSLLVSGVAGAVVDKGSIHSYIPYLSQAVKHGLQDMGVPSLQVLWAKLLDGSLRFEMRTTSAQKEGKVHDLHSFTTKLYADK
jgi:IMP dehydrogenase